ncbi:MAG TPA: tetratricopeptide repeat protein [Nitrospiria bacterium]|nr:tetratricopeptide repeat protein [Nitrospiria bacterium]
MSRYLSSIIALIIFVVQPETQAGDLAGPVFQFEDNHEGGKTFKPVMDAYYAGNLYLAIEETNHLLKTLHKGKLSETAAFLLGDFHYKLAEKEGSSHLLQALSAYQQAQFRYPQSGNSVRAIWKMGQIYAELQLYYESIASYKRVLKRDPKSPFAPWAQLGIGQTLTRWSKWKAAAQAYEKTITAYDLPEVKTTALFGLADSRYHLKEFDKAYAVYQVTVTTARDRMRADPEALLQYGEAGFRTGRYRDARDIFSILYNVHSSDPRASIALSRVADTWRQEGDTHRAQQIDLYLSHQYPKSPGDQVVRLTEAVRNLSAPEDCVALFPTSPPILCQTRPVRKTDPESPAYQEVRNQIASVIRNDSDLSVLELTLYEVTTQLRKNGEFGLALEILDRLHENPETDRNRQETTDALRQTLAEAIAQWQGRDDFGIVQLFHAHSSVFTPEMLTGKTGLAVADSHARLGLLSQAVDLYEPISIGNSPALAEEALFRLGEALLDQEKNEKAQRKLRDFLSRYPASRRAPDALAGLSEALDRQGRTNLAIQELTDWLHRYPRHPARPEVTLRLADTYRRSGRLHDEVAIYRKWIGSDKKHPAGLYVRLADAYFLLHDYPRAAEFYRRATEQNPVSGDPEWIRFQLAASLRFLGRQDQAHTILNHLAQESQDGLIRELSSQINTNL